MYAACDTIFLNKFETILLKINSKLAIIQFNSTVTYKRAILTVQWPITHLAQNNKSNSIQWGRGLTAQVPTIKQAQWHKQHK